MSTRNTTEYYQRCKLKKMQSLVDVIVYNIQLTNGYTF